MLRFVMSKKIMLCAYGEGPDCRQDGGKETRRRLMT